MKILIVRLYPYELKIDGYNVQEIGLAKALTNKGHQCDIVLYTSSNERVQEIKTDGGLIKIFWIKGINFLKNGMYGNKIINLAKQYDIIQSSEYDQLYNLKLNRKLKSKLIIYHGPYYSKFNKRYNLKCRIFDTLFLTKKYKNIKFITKSELATEFLKEKGIKNVKTIGVGLNDEMIKKENKNKILNELNENIKYLLYIGKLEERRNIIFLLNILKKIIAKKENVKLVIVGKGDKQYIDKIFEYIEKEHLESNIIYRECIGQDEVNLLYKRCKVFLLPSSYEIFGMVLLEAMYCGIPIITTKNGGSSTLIKNEKNGYIYSLDKIEEWTETIMTLLDNENISEKIIENAKKTIKDKFLWENIVDNFIECYQEKLKEN